MRAFISLELPSEVKKDLEKIQKDLKSAGVEARWVRPKNSHLTLAFLDSISPTKVETINNILEKISHQIKPVKLNLYQLGCFPSPQKPRVIFVSLQGELGKLNSLATKIRKRLKKEKIKFDQKPFSAHITLGRIRTRETRRNSSFSKNLNYMESLANKKAKKLTASSEFIAGEVTLQESTLTKSGSVYQILTQFYLSP